MGEPLLMLVPDDRHDQVSHLLPQIRAGERVEGLETVRMAKDGRPVEVSLTVSPIKDAGGQLTGVSVIVRDITRQKQVEAELRRSSRYFELSRDMVCTADFDGNFKQLNGVWTEVLGWTDSELRARPFVDFVHPDDREATIRETSRLAEGVTTIGFVNRYATKAGGWRWIDWNARIAPDEQLIYATARDVTERMTAEAAQAAGEAQTRQILESAHDAFVAMDGTGMITDWNPQAAAVFGWSRQEVLGRDLADTIIPERYRGPHRAGLAHFLATGQGPVLSERIELPAIRRDGREFPVELTISIVSAGEGCSFNAFLRDITDRRQAQQELERARDQALQASVLKSQFLANMSHEIRTPMNGVLGMAELLLDTSLDARQREYAEAVHVSGDGLLTLIDDILDLSKIEAGGLELEAVDFDVPTSIEDVAALLAGQAQAKGLEVVVDIADDMPAALRGDPGRFRQVLTNLLGNAVKFTSAGQVGVTARVIHRTEEETTVRVQVDDTGIGIAADAKARIFDPFAQADPSTTRRYGGTGLGLAITRQLVELMGGRCGLDSQAGVGTSFWFTLPLSRALADVTPRPSVTGTQLEGTDVLVVDDNVTNRVVLDGYLTGWGMKVALADSGASALDAARSAAAGERPFALVVSDMHMPGMNGLDLAAALAGDPATRGTPFVLLTSSGDDRDLGPSRDTGVSAQMIKPVRRERLRRCLAEIVSDSDEDRVVARTAPVEASTPMRRGSVLLAEDNLINQRVAVAMLESGGYAVDTVSNGTEAVRAIRSHRYDLVLMDCQMPEMDGYEAAAAIRAEEGTGRRTPIVALTAGAMEQDEERCLAAGMDGYLAKPVRRADMLAAVDRWAGKRRRRTAVTKDDPPTTG